MRSLTVAITILALSTPAIGQEKSDTDAQKLRYKSCWFRIGKRF
jgi:hypothetical protein